MSGPATVSASRRSCGSTLPRWILVRIEFASESIVRPAEEGPLVIYATREFDGFTYALHPDSVARLQSSSSRRALPQRLSVAFDVRAPLDREQGDMLEQIARLLTGLSTTDLQRMGGVEFWDPATEEALAITAPGPVAVMGNGSQLLPRRCLRRRRRSRRSFGHGAGGTHQRRSVARPHDAAPGVSSA